MMDKQDKYNSLEPRLGKKKKWSPNEFICNFFSSSQDRCPFPESYKTGFISLYSSPHVYTQWLLSHFYDYAAQGCLLETNISLTCYIYSSREQKRHIAFVYQLLYNLKDMKPCLAGLERKKTQRDRI